jgi:hypothetical protein
MVVVGPLVLMVMVMVVGVQGTYVHLQEGSVKCFSEELAPHTLVRIMYAASITTVGATGRMEMLPDQSEITRIGIKTDIKTHLGEKVLETVTAAVGEVKYVSKSAGDHIICFSTNTSHWWPGQNKMLAFEFDIRTGTEASEVASAARVEHVEAIQQAIRRLERRVSDVFTEYQYQKLREHRSRETSESTNERVLWWSLGQIMIVVGAGLWQVMYLRKFFTKKNIH